MRTNAPQRGHTLLDVPKDADALTEPGRDVDDVDETSDAVDQRGDAADVDAAEVAAADVEDAGVDSQDATAAAPEGEDVEGSPFGDELRLPDEHGYEGEAYLDEDELLGSDGELDELDDAMDFEGEFLLPGEYEEEGAELLFDGDPDEFELEVGVGPYPDARPQPGDLLVLDDPGARPVRPPVRRMSRAERRRRVRLQARRVRRIVRHVEPWSVLKISIFFYACLWVIFLVAGFMIWGVAEGSGTVAKLESLIIQLFALDTFEFDAGQMFRGYALGGLALAIAGTTFNVLMCLLFNLISDLPGGLRITMIEEETARPTPPRRRRRRPPVRR